MSNYTNVGDESLLADIEISIEDQEIMEFGEPLDKEIMDDEEMMTKISAYLRDEIQWGLLERENMVKYWKRWNLQRMGRPEEDVKNTPWQGASNQQSAEMMAKINTTFTSLIPKYENKKPFWKVTSRVAGSQEMAKALEAVLDVQAESPYFLDFTPKKRGIVYETASMGDCFVKGLWETEKHNFRRKSGEQVSKIRHDGPQLRLIALEDFLTRAAFVDLDKAPWYAVRTTYFEYEVDKLVKNGIFRNAENLNVETAMPPVTEMVHDRQGQAPKLQSGEGVVYVWEVTMFWDVDGDGVDEDITVFFHEDSGRILRVSFDELSVRDVVQFRWLGIPHMLYSMGLCAMGDGTQQAISSYLNIATNSTALHALQMTIEREGSGSEKRDLFPGGRIIADNPDDIRPFAFPNTAPQAMAMKQDAQRDLNTATGTNPAMGGQPDTVMKSRFSLGGYNAQASKGSSMTEVVSQNMDTSFNRLGQLMVYIMIANGDESLRVFEGLLEDKYKEGFREAMNLKVEDIPQNFDFVVRATAVDETRDSQRQKYFILNQIHDQYVPKAMSYYGQAIQLLMQAQQTKNPQLIEAAKFAYKMAAAKAKLTEKTFEFLGVEEPDELVAYYKDTLMAAGMEEDLKDEQIKEVENASRGQARGVDGSPRELPIPGNGGGDAAAAGAMEAGPGDGGGPAGDMGPAGEVPGN